MLENVSDLEIKIRIVKGEIRENKREKEKSLSAVFSLIGCLISVVVGSIYFFVIKKESELWQVFFAVFLGLGCLILGYYWYSKYKKACQKLEQLEKELYLLKKGLNKE